MAFATLSYGKVTERTLVTFLLNNQDNTNINRSTVALTNHPVTAYVPLAETDNIRSVDNLGVYASGVKVDAVFQPIAYWWDTPERARAGSPIKMLRVTFKATISANSTDATTYTLKVGGPGSFQGPGISVTTDTNYYEITTGTVAGSGRFRVRRTGGGGHNVLESGEVLASGGSWTSVLSTSNTSALYLHGVTNAAGAQYIPSSKSDIDADISANQLNGKTLIYRVSSAGSDTTVTFPSGTNNSKLAILAIKDRADVVFLGSLVNGMRARLTPNETSLEFVPTVPTETITIRSTGTANALLGLSTVGDTASVAFPNTQNADYDSNAYTGGIYAVTLDENTPYRVVVKVVGKYGTSGSEFQGMNDEANLCVTQSLSSNGESRRNASDLTYEQRYTFYPDSAYVHMDLLIKGAGASTAGAVQADAAIENGGIRIAPNFTATGLAIQDSDIAYVSGTKYAYQDSTVSGASNGFSIAQSGFAASGTELTDGFMAVGNSSKHLALMYRNTPKELWPHGWKYDGTSAFLEFWPTGRGHIEGAYTGRSYHIFAGQWYYRVECGLMLGDGAYSVATVRSNWKKWCRAPVVVHCTDKYETSKVFGPLAPPMAFASVSSTNYRCILDHVATASTAPPNATYWAATNTWSHSATRFAVPHKVGARYSAWYSNSWNGSALTDWDEAFDRFYRWKYTLIDRNCAADGWDLLRSYEERNNSLYTLYGWCRFGAYTRGGSLGRCASNRYDATMRFMWAWMMTGDVEHYEWGRRLADHMNFICTIHWDGAGVGAPGQWAQYSENDNLEAAIHGQTRGQGAASSTQHCGYKAQLYLLTGYTPFRTAAEKMVDYNHGAGWHYALTMGDGTADNGTNSNEQLPREYAWPMDGFLTVYECLGYAPAIYKAHGICKHALLYTDQQLITDGSALEVAGGPGWISNRAGYGTAGSENVTQANMTGEVYTTGPFVRMSELAAKASAYGYHGIFNTAFTFDNESSTRSFNMLDRLKVFCRQGPRSLFLGADGVSRNKADTLAQRLSLSWPICRGGNKTGGNSSAIQGPWGNYWRANSYAAAFAWNDSSIRLVNDGYTAFYSTAQDSVTVAIDAGGTNLTFSSALGEQCKQLFFYVAGDSANAVKITTHTRGTTTATCPAYNATYRGQSGLSFFITHNAISRDQADIGPAQPVHHILAMGLGSVAYEAYRAGVRGELAASSYASTFADDMFENLFLYGIITDSAASSWDATYADTDRGNIRPGNIDSDIEREQAWMNFRGPLHYLYYRKNGAF